MADTAAEIAREARSIGSASPRTRGRFNLLPGLLGVLLAAPLMREFEHGTYRLAWTQSVSRQPGSRRDRRSSCLPRLSSRCS